MRYLLLSVLVVCMIGIMVPSVFGDEEPVMEGLYFYTGDFCSEDEPCSLVHAGEYYEKAGLGERFELQEEYHGGGTGTKSRRRNVKDVETFCSYHHK